MQKNRWMARLLNFCRVYEVELSTVPQFESYKMFYVDNSECQTFSNNIWVNVSQNCGERTLAIF